MSQVVHVAAEVPFSVLDFSDDGKLEADVNN